MLWSFLLADIPALAQSNTFPWPSSGNVGIGTTNPSANLQIVNGTSPTATFLKLSYDPYGTADFTFSRSWVSGALSLQGNETGFNNILLAPTSGNVGIGTPSPAHLLHVAGTIGAEEVIVSSTGADYVFRPGYRLRPLSEVASYIEANHHLPDIPSADEVKQKGMGVGEMEAKLLAKIEELTLHMIQADERNSRLEKQNQDLRDRIARLEAARPIQESAQ